MIPRKIKEIANSLVRNFSAPNNWNKEADGNCVNLWVRVRQEAEHLVFESAWEPTPEELKILNAGGSVVIKIVGGQPPIWIYAEE